MTVGSVLWLLALCSVEVLAQEAETTVPVPDGTVEEPRRTFDEREYEGVRRVSEAYEQANAEQQAELTEREREIERLRQLLEQQAVEQGHLNPTSPGSVGGEAAGSAGPDGTTQLQRPTAPSTPTAREPVTVGQVVGRSARPAPAAPRALLFSVPRSSQSLQTESISVLPAGSYVKVRILTGVEATAREELPMLVQADYAMVGPNGRKMDMRGCMVLLQVRGELSVDRVVGQAVRLSCVRDDGESVVRDINGYLAGEDSTFGAPGQLISRQGRVLAAATIAALAEGAGDAVAMAQSTQQVVTSPLGPTGQTTQNVTGNTTAYVVGSSTANAAENIADWYLRYAEQLVPAIAVGSGRDVWVVLIDSVAIPNLRVEG